MQYEPLEFWLWFHINFLRLRYFSQNWEKNTRREKNEIFEIMWKGTLWWVMARWRMALLSCLRGLQIGAMFASWCLYSTCQKPNRALWPDVTSRSYIAFICLTVATDVQSGMANRRQIQLLINQNWLSHWLTKLVESLVNQIGSVSG